MRGHISRALSVSTELDPVFNRIRLADVPMQAKDSSFDVIGVVQRAERTVTSASSFTLLHLLDETLPEGTQEITVRAHTIHFQQFSPCSIISHWQQNSSWSNIVIMIAEVKRLSCTTFACQAKYAKQNMPKKICSAHKNPRCCCFSSAKAAASNWQPLSMPVPIKQVSPKKFAMHGVNLLPYARG